MVLRISDGEVEGSLAPISFPAKELEVVYLLGLSVRRVSSLDGSLFVPVSVVIVVADGIRI